MNYQKIYTDFYSKYYDKAEFLMQLFFIKRKSQNRAFGDTYNSAFLYLSGDFIGKHIFEKNEHLKQLHLLFGKRYSFYETDQEQEIFTNELKNEFDTISFSKLPKDYNYNKLIKDIAIIEAVNEILRLMSCNYSLFSMMYKLNEFELFEIREYKGIALEDTAKFKKLHLKLYPEYYTQSEGLGITINTEEQNIIFLLFKNFDVYDCFIEYQKHIIDFYTDYSYLKKRLEKEKLIHYHKDNDFMKIVYKDLKLISEKKYNEYFIYGKLKSLTKSYNVQRENNFNIIFEDLL